MKRKNKIIVCVAILLLGISGAATWFFLFDTEPLVTTPDIQITEAPDSGESFGSDKECGVDEVTVAEPKHFAFGMDGEDATLTVCPNSSLSSEGTHVIDIRLSNSERIQLIAFEFRISPELFDLRLVDLDGDGALDLLVPSHVIGGGPYIAVDAYRYSSASKQLELDRGISGISWPSIAATKGCVVEKFKNGSDGHYANRHCFDKQSEEWTQTDSCKLGDGDESVCPGQLLK